MHETRQVRIAKLRDAVKHHRSRLALWEQTLRIVPVSEKDRFLVRMHEIEDELRAMEKGLHDLHLQQIREEPAN
jgi:hypothetical protein